MLEQETADNREPVAGFGKARPGHSIVVHVALPLQMVGRGKGQVGRFDADVVPFAGTQQQFMGQQSDG